MSSDTEAWQIVRDLARSDATVVNYHDHDECGFCHNIMDDNDNNFKVTHKATCLIARAHKLTGEGTVLIEEPQQEVEDNSDKEYWMQWASRIMEREI